MELSTLKLRVLIYGVEGGDRNEWRCTGSRTVEPQLALIRLVVKACGEWAFKETGQV